MMHKHSVYVVLSVFMCALSLGAMHTPPDIFERLRQNAEAMYRVSSTQKPNVPARAKIARPPQPPQRIAHKMEHHNSAALSLTEQIKLARHPEFSEKWWKALLGNCKGCDNPDKRIDCDKLIAENPQWLEVELMSPQAKRVIMQRVLDQINTDQGPCKVACAVCVGADPNERATGTSATLDYFWNENHTALHLSTGAWQNGHFGLFALLLEHGANPEANCRGAVPSGFDYPSRKWRSLLEDYIDGRKKASAKTDIDDDGYDDIVIDVPDDDED